MSKRSLEREDGDRPPKRPKPDGQRPPPVTVEEIHYARQLQQLLVFRQDATQQLRSGIASFKAFLESILYHKEEENRVRQLSILREYLDKEKPEEVKDTERPFLGQLWQAWSFANQNNNDHLASQVSAVLALLLRTLSGELDFREYGVLLCRTVLLHQHLRLVKRCLDAPKHKDFIISPSLRLLTEVTSFDGGVLAREVYKRREQTFEISSIRRNLSLVRPESGIEMMLQQKVCKRDEHRKPNHMLTALKRLSEEEARRKPSIRTLTVRYVLAHLKYLHEGGKIDLLKSRPLCVALFHHVSEDPTELVNDILSVSEQNVLKDGELPRSAKSTLLVQHNLERVTEVATRLPDHPSAEKAFAWLKAVCTAQSYGIFRPSGWYPPGTTQADDQHADRDSAIDLGLDNLEFYDRVERPDVRNTTLLGWLQTLRPHSNPKERELVTVCFHSAPELVAAYFSEKSMQLEPKLSNTWIGYASFLFEVISQPVPPHLGHTDEDQFASLPPQTNIVLESILPKPLTQKVLTRCLNQSHKLITFFAVRILVLAFQKVRNVLGEMRKAAEFPALHRDLWVEAAERLLSRLSLRVPAMKDVISTFRQTPDDDEHALQREANARLLSLYYEVTPVQALQEQFDVSSVLNNALGRDTDIGQRELSGLRALELEHLLVIAQKSPGMRWFSKQGTLQYSPVTSLLRLHTCEASNSQIKALVLQVLQEQNIIIDAAEMQALVASLNGIDGVVWTFVDDCMARASRQPVKYVDQLEAAVSTPRKVTDDVLPGLLSAAVVEQAPFAITQPSIVAWVHTFLQAMTLLDHCGVQGWDASCRNLAIVRLRERLSKQHADVFPSTGEPAEQIVATLQAASLPEPVSAESKDCMEIESQPSLPFSTPLPESDNHPELSRWAQKDLGIAIEDGDIDALVLCLSSQHLDIRRQAYAQLRILATKLQNSTLDEREQFTVLIGELIETYEQQCAPADESLPHLAGTFAVHALHVLQEPTHAMYPKVNRFLIKSPEWRVSRLPSYWLANTILAPPEEDDAYWREVHWVLVWLVDGLRTPADLDICRRARVFEKVMALYSSPAASVRSVKERVMELLYRATCVVGGSAVLVTRCGVLAWLEMVGARGGDVAGLMRRRVLETVERERLVAWAGLEVS
ncbi:Ribosome 60S biogenesis N-terminal [Teratosphaeria destructans]|uniref:Ribosome 60S biogenesis N-terminal n=1 Tax=Teratosphaeria destructans TaxID=418781 RepID=A0A9W7SXP5_9PEZI|nr:Ribosome 60S biogenesis N-terminal [Teratosphaeria destructans]